MGLLLVLGSVLYIVSIASASSLGKVSVVLKFNLFLIQTSRHLKFLVIVDHSYEEIVLKNFVS